MLRLTQKWCYPKPLENGTEGSRGTVAVRRPSFPFLGGFFLSAPALQSSFRSPPVLFNHFHLPLHLPRQSERIEALLFGAQALFRLGGDFRAG